MVSLIQVFRVIDDAKIVNGGILYGGGIYNIEMMNKRLPHRIVSNCILIFIYDIHIFNADNKGVMPDLYLNL